MTRRVIGHLQAWDSEAVKNGRFVCRDVNYILDKDAVGMIIIREGTYDGDELVLRTWKVRVDHQ